MLRCDTSTWIACLVLMLFALPSEARGHKGEHDVPHHELADATEQLLTSLSPELRAKATFAFDGAERTDWHFIPKDRVGVSLKEMSWQQRRAAHRLLRTALSNKGYLKATTIMSLEQVLRVLENDAARRDQEKYWFSVFGKPGHEKPWGWRIEGHHLSINFSSVSGVIAASTPLFLGSNPAEIRSGPRAGLRVLSAEEDLARALVESLDEGQRAKALIATEAPRDVITAPGAKIDLGDPAGLAHSEMTTQQREGLWRLITEYANNLRIELADEELTQIQDAGRRNIYFAWAGSVESGEGHYYRIHGPTFIIEYDNTQNGANHVHTVWHSLTNDFGLDALKKHLTESPHH